MIASTGQRFFPPVSHVAMPARTIEGLADYFVKEIKQGIDGTGIKNSSDFSARSMPIYRAGWRFIW